MGRVLANRKGHGCTVRPSIRPSVRPSVCPTVRPSVRPMIFRLSVRNFFVHFFIQNFSLLRRLHIQTPDTIKRPCGQILAKSFLAYLFPPNNGFKPMKGSSSG